jgi:hypothetical protein
VFMLDAMPGAATPLEVVGQLCRHSYSTVHGVRDN